MKLKHSPEIVSDGETLRGPYVRALCSLEERREINIIIIIIIIITCLLGASCTVSDVSCVNHTHHQETRNCNYSLRTVQLPPSRQVVIIIISRHSSREHRALTKFRHPTRFLVSALTSFHVLPCCLISSRIVLRQGGSSCTKNVTSTEGCS